MVNEVILKVSNLSKNYGKVNAVKNISFEVRRGDFFSFLGVNGAGKSTTIKILTTLLKQTGGNYMLNNRQDNKYIRSKIGVVFQENVLDHLLTIKENLMFHASMIYKNKITAINKYQYVKKFLELDNVENRKYKDLSGGQKRRAEIARALIGEPEILFLDEPTTGLDPESRKLVWSAIKKLQKEKNITVFLTTHYMEESNESDYVVIINNGIICAEGTPDYLKSVYAKNVLKIEPINKEKFLNEINISTVQNSSNLFIINNISNEAAINVLNNNKKNVSRFEYVSGTMDDVFLAVVKKKGEL